MTITKQAAAQGADGVSGSRKPKQKREVSPDQRRAELVIASLFIITAAASIPSAFLIDPILNSADYLAKVFPNQGMIVLGSLLWSINNIGIIFIAVFAFRVLRKLDEAMSVGYLASRIVEGTIMMVGIMATFLLIPLSRDFIVAGSPEGSSYQVIGEVLKHAKFLGLTQISLPMLGLGGMIFTGMLFRFRLVPRVISAIGVVSYAIVFFGGLAAWFGFIDTAPGSVGSLLAIPVATFEIILLPFWLFFRGFRTFEPGKTKD